MKWTETIHKMKKSTLFFLLQTVFICSTPLMVNGQDCLYDTDAPSIDCNIAAPQNLLLNESFEINAVHDQLGASNWVRFGPVFTIDENVLGTAQEGDFFVQMFGGNTGLFQDVPVNGGDNLTGTVYMQNASFDPANQVGGGQIKLEWIGTPGVETSPVFTALNPQDVWTEVSINTVAPPGATGVRFVIICNQPEGGAIMYDNASLINTTQTGGGLVGDVSVENDPGACGAQLTLATPLTADNCTVVSVTNDYTGTGNASGFYPIGTTTVTWTVTDDGLGATLPDVAMLFSTGGVPNAESDVLSKLTSSGAFNSVTSIDVIGATPSLATLQGYDAVLVWNDDPFADDVALGNVLADYVDAGGGVVVSMFTQFLSPNPGVPEYDLEGVFGNNGYLPLDGTENSLPNTGPETMNIVNGSHPILSGVTSFNGGTRSFRGSNLSLQSDATLLANWSTGEPLIAYKEPTNGRTVSLNFYPPSIDARFDLWDVNTDGDLIMANSLLWAAGHVRTPNTATCSVDITVTDSEAPTINCTGPQNLLANNSFENGASHDAIGSQGWNEFFEAWGSVREFDENENVNAAAQDGSFFIKMFGPNSGLFQDFPVSEDDIVTGTVYMQNASFDPTGVGSGQIKLEWLGVAGVITSAPFTNAEPQDVWTEFTVNAIAPAGATGVRFVLSSNLPNGGAIMYDNASLTIIPPNAGLYGDLTVETDLGACGAQLSLAVPVSGDNCPGSTLINDFNGSGDASGFYPVGITPITWTATDVSGIAVECVQTITVVDITPPVLTCPDNIVQCYDDGFAVFWTPPTPTDVCSSTVTLVGTHQPGDLFSLLKTTVTYTATDEYGNSAECSFTVEVNPPLSVDAGGCQTSYIGYGPAENENNLLAEGSGGTGPYTYLWSGGPIDTDPTGQTVTVPGLVTTTYTVVVTDASGCTATDDVDVFVESVICSNNSNNEKILICHDQNGQDGGNTICISENAVDNHIGEHGDTYGMCGNECNATNPAPIVPGVNPDDIADDGLQSANKALTVENQLSIYPNPNAGNFTIVTDMKDYVVSIYDISGKLVRQERSTQRKLNIDLTQVESGIYFVQLHNEKALLTEKVIIEQ